MPNKWLGKADALTKNGSTRQEHIQDVIRQDAAKVILNHLRQHDTCGTDVFSMIEEDECLITFAKFVVQVTSVSDEMCQALLINGFLESHLGGRVCIFLNLFKVFP